LLFYLSTHSTELHVLWIRCFHLSDFLNSYCLGSLFTARWKTRKEKKSEKEKEKEKEKRKQKKEKEIRRR